jgi:hypothetical protein
MFETTLQPKIMRRKQSSDTQRKRLSLNEMDRKSTGKLRIGPSQRRLGRGQGCPTQRSVEAFDLLVGGLELRFLGTDATISMKSMPQVSFYLRIPNSSVVPVGPTARTNLGLFYEGCVAPGASPVDTMTRLLVGATWRSRIVGLGIVLVESSIKSARLGTFVAAICQMRILW